jgi:hypothetical protein
MASNLSIFLENEMGTLDTALKDADSAMFNPPCKEADTFTPKQLRWMTDDMMDRLLANGSLLGDVIYGECIHDKQDLAFNCSQACRIGDLISNVLTCRRDDLDEHIENLRNMFAGNLQPMAEDMAREYLENGEED